MVIVKGEWAVLGVKLGRPVVTNGDGDALFPNYFGENLFYIFSDRNTAAHSPIISSAVCIDMYVHRMPERRIEETRPALPLKFVARQRPLSDRKNKIRSIM